MTDICSILTWREIVDEGYVGKRQAQVLKMFAESGREFTATQVVRAFVKVGNRRQSENVRNRITELEKMGYLDVRRDYCPETLAEQGKKRLVKHYKYNGRIKPKVKKIESGHCPRCKGTGKVDLVVYE